MTRILGVDFSGASDAGRKIWIAEGKASSRGAFRLDSVIPAIDLPGSGKSPAQAIPALARHIAALGDARVGCDFPFALPQEQMGGASWRSFVLRYAADFTDADTFRALMRSRFPAEAKRLTDRIARTPFNAYNLRLYRQTWWGISGLLAPLVQSRAATVWPHQRVKAGKPVLIEICPACTLKALDLYPSYKGRGPLLRKARARILDGLIGHGALAPPPPSLHRLLLDNAGGDALDAVIGALAALHADLDAKPSAQMRREGWVYYGIGR